MKNLKPLLVALVSKMLIPLLVFIGGVLAGQFPLHYSAFCGVS